MQGVYRVRAGGRTLTETFVAAPGPMGWRYVGRLSEPDGGADVLLVDYVVDLGWNLVRVRMAAPSGWEAIVTPVPGGLEVWTPGGEAVRRFDDAVVVWSASPVSLLVAEHLARTTGRWAFTAVASGMGEEPEAVQVSLEPAGQDAVRTPTGSSQVNVVNVTTAEGTRRALVRADLPLSCHGWFDLIG